MGLTLETARLRLRPATAADVDAFHALWTDPAVRQFLWDDVVIPRERAEEVVAASVECFETRRFGTWAVIERASDRLVGFAGLRSAGADGAEVELLYGLSPAYWGRGLATEAARAVLRYGFRALGLGRIVAATDAPNRASVRVMEKLGMTFERRERVGHLPYDQLHYAITREAFDAA